eukprot:358811-Chlamydomonas_euryale.AAC.18
MHVPTSIANPTVLLPRRCPGHLVHLVCGRQHQLARLVVPKVIHARQRRHQHVAQPVKLRHDLCLDRHEARLHAAKVLGKLVQLFHHALVARIGRWPEGARGAAASGQHVMHRAEPHELHMVGGRGEEAPRAV